jgi:hypothetical protein
MRDYHSQPTTQNKTVLKAQRLKRGISWTPTLITLLGLPTPTQDNRPAFQQVRINLHLHLAPEANLITGPGNGAHTRILWCSLFLKRNTNLSYTSSDQRDLKFGRVCWV